MTDPSRHSGVTGEIAALWRKLPNFWRFQLAGWLLFALGNTLLKAVLLQNVKLAVASTLYQDTFGFLLTLLLYRYYHRLPHGLPSSRIALRVVIACLLLTTADMTWFASVRDMLFSEHELILRGTRGLLAVALNRFLLYVCWSFLYFWIKAALAHQAAVSAANTAQLQALRAQLNPHFLFNALNSIAAEADDNPRAVKALAHELANYLRYSLAHRHADNVTLAAEIEAMTHYLNVEKARFEERLNFSIEVTPEARATPVPGFFLQPLVENAVKHGLRTSPAAMRILIRAACADGMLRIEVGNTGLWRETVPAVDHQGFGLESIRARLQLIYPGHHRFDIAHGDGWVNVTIEMPRS